MDLTSNNEMQKQEVNYIEVILDKIVLKQLGHEVKRDEENRTMIIYKNGKEVDNLDIPAIYTYNGNKYKITEIGSYAFRGCTLLTSITIPNSVTEIDLGAFWGCTSLTSVTIPNSVTEIGDLSFLNCTSLISITIPNGVTKIAGMAFHSCISLTSVTLPDSVTEIGLGAFSRCTSLKEINIPKNIKEIKLNAFKGCNSLKCLNYSKEFEVSLNNEVLNQLGYEVKRDEENRTMIIYKNGKEVDNLDIPAIYTYNGNKYKITEIGSYAFWDCTSLISVTIPNSVTEIGKYAFYDCISLTNVTIPDSVTRIRDCAFDGCTSLVNLTIPKGCIQMRGGYPVE